MEKGNEFNLGDVIQHKATGMIGVVIVGRGKATTVRNSDNQIQEYYNFELVKMTDDFVDGRLENLRRIE